LRNWGSYGLWCIPWVNHHGTTHAARWRCSIEATSCAANWWCIVEAASWRTTEASSRATGEATATATSEATPTSEPATGWWVMGEATTKLRVRQPSTSMAAEASPLTLAARPHTKTRLAKDTTHAMHELATAAWDGVGRRMAKDASHAVDELATAAAHGRRHASIHSALKGRRHAIWHVHPSMVRGTLPPPPVRLAQALAASTSDRAAWTTFATPP
jgi:hypothetical protein